MSLHPELPETQTMDLEGYESLPATTERLKSGAIKS
jgi:hypothetical protein